ncbi:MAG: hypothetical protein LUI87_07050 [Lachnospiraceae bacterium]|nr:hypothetical protein [Lachnospiraceae bacterium]
MINPKILRTVTIEVSADKLTERNKTPKCPTPFHALNIATNGGWAPGDLIGLCGAPNVGKTPLALLFAKEAAKAGHPVVFLSTDMTDEQLSAVVLSGESFADCPATALSADDILNLDNNNLPLKHYLKGLTKPYNGHLLLCGTSSWTHMVEDIPLVLDDFPADLAGKHPLIFVDYVQKVRSKSTLHGQTEKDTVDNVLPHLKELATDAQATVIAVCAIHRDYYDTPMIPLQGLRNSSNLEYDMDTIMTLQFYGLSMGKTSLQAKSMKKRNLDLVISKQRFGAVGDKIHFLHIAEYNHFEEYTEDDALEEKTPNMTDTATRYTGHIDDFLSSDTSPQDVIEIHGSLHAASDVSDDLDDICTVVSQKNIK